MTAADRNGLDGYALRTAGGAAWTALGAVLAQVLALGSGVVVARAVGPDLYGAAAVAVVVVGFLGGVRDFGLVPAIVSRRADGRALLDSMHWLFSAAGILLAGFVVAIAPLVARFFREPGLAGLLMVAGASIALGGWSVLPLALLQRDGRFSALSGLGVARQLASSAAALTLALAGRGVWALVVPALVAAGFNAVASWSLCGRRPSLTFAWAKLRVHVGGGLDVVGFSVANFLTRNADTVVVGRLFGQTALGNYAFAYNTLTRPLDLIAGSVANSLLPTLGALRDDHVRFDRAVVRAATATARLATPIFVGGALTAGLLVEVLYGPHWVSAVPLVRVFMLLGAPQAVATLAGPVWLSQGHTRLLLWWGLCTGAGGVAVFLVAGLLGDVTSIASAYALYSVVLTALSALLTRRVCHVPLAGLEHSLARVARDVAVMATVVLSIRLGCETVGVAPATALFTQVVAGCFSYVSAFRIFSREELGELVQLLPRRVQRPLARVLAVD